MLAERLISRCLFAAGIAGCTVGCGSSSPDAPNSGATAGSGAGRGGGTSSGATGGAAGQSSGGTSSGSGGSSSSAGGGAGGASGQPAGGGEGGEVGSGGGAGATGVLKIMPIGDSITVGSSGTNAGYRGPLYNLLKKSVPQVLFVGSSLGGGVTTNVDPLPVEQQHHEGHSSYTINDVNNNLDGLDTATFEQYGGADRDPNGGHWFDGIAGSRCGGGSPPDPQYGALPTENGSR